MFAVFRWWLGMCLTVGGLGTAHFFNFFKYAWIVDQTKLVFVIVVLFLMTVVFIGLLTFHARHGDQYFRKYEELCYYMSEVFVTLGLIGTVIGLLLAYHTMGTTDITAGAHAIQSMSSRIYKDLSTSGLPTVVGLATFVVTRGFLVNLGFQRDDHE